jgi:mono/diheme cytochrome c family protein
VPGTVARGAQLSEDPYYLGYTPDANTAALPGSDSAVVRLVSAQDDPAPQEPKVEEPKAEEPAPQEPAPQEPAPQEPAPQPAEPPASEPASTETKPQTPAETPQPAEPVAEAKQDEAKPAEAKPAEVKSDVPVDTVKPADQPASAQEPAKAQPVNPAQPTTPAQPPVAAGQAAPQVPDRNYLQKLPEQLEANEELFALGRRKFEQVCSACHGFAGFGNGLVAKRAESIQASYWLQPTSVHDERILKQPIGQIYFTITNGKGKMAGYGSTLNVKERWAVALYVKALQRSQHAEESDLAGPAN